MAKFKAFKDMFDFNSTIMEREWIDGQQYQMEYKVKRDGFEFKNVAKVAEPKDGSHKVALEVENKFKFEQFGGTEGKWKLKNSGELACEMWNDSLKQYEGMDGLRIYMKQTLGPKPTPLAMGLTYAYPKFQGDWLVDTTGGNGMVLQSAWRVQDWCSVGWKKEWKSVTNPMGDVKWSTGFAAGCDNNIQWGCQVTGDSKTIADTKMKDATLYFHHATKSVTTGSEIKYDCGTKAFTSKLGLIMKNDDHTWKFRFHDSGAARVGLEWKMHPACVTFLNTSVDLKDVVGGKVSKLPIGASFKLEY